MINFFCCSDVGHVILLIVMRFVSIVSKPVTMDMMSNSFDMTGK